MILEFGLKPVEPHAIRFFCHESLIIYIHTLSLIVLSMRKCVKKIGLDLAQTSHLGPSNKNPKNQGKKSIM